MSINLPIFYPVFLYPRNSYGKNEIYDFSCKKPTKHNKNKKKNRKTKDIYKKEPDWSKLRRETRVLGGMDEFTAWWLYYNMK